MDDRFETAFVVEIPPADAWQRLVDAAPTNPDGKTWWLPGFDASGEEIEVDAGRLLRVRKATEPCAGTEISITLEAAESGTRVTVVQSGFGTWFEAALEGLSIGWSHIVADLVLYFEVGVSGGRHLLPWASLGCSLRAAPAGVEVLDVFPGGYADRTGIQRGDVLLTVGGAPVVTRAEFETLMRVFKTGDTVESSWARGSDRLSGTGVL